MKCPKCGSELDVNSKFCGTCGFNLVNNSQPQPINQYDNMNVNNGIGSQPIATNNPNPQSINEQNNYNSLPNTQSVNNPNYYNVSVNAQPMNQNGYNASPNKKKKSFKGIVVVLVLIALIVGGIFVGKKMVGPKDDTEKYNIAINVPEGIKVKTYVSLEHGQLIVHVINKSGKNYATGWMVFNYFDEDRNKDTSRGLTSFDIFENNNEMVWYFPLPDKDLNDYYFPSKAEVEIKFDEENQKFADSISGYSKKLSYSYSGMKDGKAEINIKNVSNDVVYVPDILAVVYYKNSRPIYVGTLYSLISEEIKPGKEYSDADYVPYDFAENGDYIYMDYDDVKVYRIRG